MNIHYKEKDSFLGKVLCVSNGIIEFCIAKEVGPRIIAFNKKGEENILFEDINDKISKDVSSIYGKDAIWHIYGGHRVWLSPEKDETYYPDNNPVKIERTERGVIVASENRKKQNVIISLKVEFVGKNSIEINQKVINSGEKRKLSIWGLTVTKAGGDMQLFLENQNTFLLPNRNLVFWPYTDLNDKRLQIYNDTVEVKSTEKVSKPLKFGSYSRHIKAKYNYGKDVFIKEFYADKGREFYPDFCCNFECYISDIIHEIESLSPLETVANGEQIESKEKWTLE